MAERKSVNFLPEYLRSVKNSKFLSSTIDQLIAPPQLERIDGYVGSKITPNYDPENDIYLKQPQSLRKDYQLEPSMVFKDSVGKITDVIGFDDIVNELAIQGARTSNLDKILRTSYYSYDPLIDWDKLINYSEYYWLPNGPGAIIFDNTSVDLLVEVVNKPTYVLPSGHKLTNGLKVVFSKSTSSNTATIVQGTEYIVEGVGNQIKFIDFQKLEVNEPFAETYNETFDSDGFDEYPYDTDIKLPITPEYVTINRSSTDLNSWSRYNRWFHGDVIKIESEINGKVFLLPAESKAKRPIIEFKPNLQLYNFGVRGIDNVDLIDTDTKNALSTINGSYGYYVDGVLLQQGDRVIFNADEDETVRNKIYKVTFTTGSSPVIQLVLISTAQDLDSVAINKGNNFGGKSFYFKESEKVWKSAQQHTTINQAPLFDLFDAGGNSYAESGTINDFAGTKIFGYAIGSGTPDEVLGFPLRYQNSIGVGSFLFHNFFMTDVINITEGSKSSQIKTNIGYLKLNNSASNFVNVWSVSSPYQIPIVELQVVSETTSSVVVSSLDKPFTTATSITSFVNGIRTNNTTTIGGNITVSFEKQLTKNDVIKLDILTSQLPNENGYYETPLSLTNNPLNNDIADFTLSELADHVGTMVGKIPEFEGVYPGISNLRDLNDYAKFGNRLVINKTPIAFTKLFFGKSEHNVIKSLQESAILYNQYKLNFINHLQKVDNQLSPIDAVDYILKLLNKNKDARALYYRSDMVPYGSDRTLREYTVGPLLNAVYPLGIEYNPNELSFTAVSVYVNNVQLVYGKEYTINSIDQTLTILITLNATDVVQIYNYEDTLGSYVPLTPTKLGLYPKYQPEIYFDDSYLDSPVKLIKGHDGSVIKAFNDYRDDFILEFEKRIYNNIKTSYNEKVFDVLASRPGAFRNSKYLRQDEIDILTKEFIRWAGSYNVDVETNNSFDEANAFTYNYSSAIDNKFGKSVPGNWKGIFDYFYDTIRPHTHPWEMLGFIEEPSWWKTEYGLGPYTSTNTTMWTDLENGYARGINEYRPNYSRPGLSTIIPVDISGNLLSPDLFLVSETSLFAKKSKWKFGDYGPAEFSWRRSSFYPFAANILAALLEPINYSSLLFDVSRLSFNEAGQLLYDNELYISPKKLKLDNGNTQIAGFGNFIIERGKSRDLNYLDNFFQDITYCNFNLFHKLGGFSSKEKLQVIIDSIDPVSTGIGAILPPEDYELLLNVSNPITAARISGIIVQLVNGNYVVKGYDKENPYFQIYKPIKSNTGQTVSVGGISESFVDYISVISYGDSGLSNADLTSAESNTTKYYKQGQIVRYNNKFYRVKIGHLASAQFDNTLFQQLSGLPTKGGAEAVLPYDYETKITNIPYGTEFTSVQQVFDFILGYGHYLEKQGFIFDEYNNELFNVLDWTFTGKEFLYWSTQNWAEGNLITLSPFANNLKFNYSNSIVDDITGKNYEYSLLKADGRPFPREKFSLVRDDGTCTISTIDTDEGIFFAVLHLVQKEHAMVFNNDTIFNDTIYDIESGYRQRRIKLSGFRTSNWNGDYQSPGFIYDNVDILDWEPYTAYVPGSVVRYNGVYYQANSKIDPVDNFDFTQWSKLYDKPIPNLLPNFEYRINQFEDFYSLDIDNFDSGQQILSQRLLGYIQRPYLSNIFVNPITQYKFYQGFIREKGTRNAIDKISKAGAFTRQGTIDFNEEWAFRIGNFGGYESYTEYEFALQESLELENPYIVKFVDTIPKDANPLINYTSSTGVLLKPDNFDPNNIFPVFNNSTFDSNNIKLLTAGYVRLDDVTYTAYNRDSLLDIANNSDIKNKNTIWVGFLENGDWTVYRYTRQRAKISGVFVSSPAEEITFVTNIHHGLSAGDIVSVVQFNEQVNGVYRVVRTPTLNQFTVASDLSTIVNEELLAYGALFKFENARFENYLKLSQSSDIINLDQGDKVWIDRADEKWAVYEKIKNYSLVESINSPSSPSSQQLGYTIFTKENSSAVIVSSLSWNVPVYSSDGRISLYEKFEDRITKQLEYILNSNGKFYCQPNTATSFGYSLNYDIDKELIFAGAPSASKVRSPGVGVVVYSTGTGTAKTFDSEGLVKISVKKALGEFEETKRVLLPPHNFADTIQKAANMRFGHSVYVNQTFAVNSTTLLVSAPGDGVINTSTGHVFCYYLNTTTSGDVDITPHSQGITLSSTAVLTNKSKFGNKIVGSNDGNFIAVTAPNFVSGDLTGVVQIYNSNLTCKQVLYSPFDNASFGYDVAISDSGKFLIISSTETKESGKAYGKVAIYTATNLTSSGTYVLRQIINNPEFTNDLKFGHSLSISEDENSLIVSSLGINRSKQLTFDFTNNEQATTFDADTTKFIDPIEDSGAVYVYNNLGDYFILADELNEADMVEGSRYGFSVAATNNSVFVGAPWYEDTTGEDFSTFYQYKKIVSEANSWNLTYFQQDLVDVESINRIILINSNEEKIIDYLDVIDPIKGKIAGIAEQELKYKIAVDPAVYTIGILGTVNDDKTNWIDEHVGELWWDLSTAKYTWYEQGNEIFRKNNWGQLFPGATIDVYEWVKSDLLPSEWAAQADTNEGLTKGISGQPKYPDNSVVSVKQVWNSVTNSFNNVYYFWVKNKVTIPDVKNRRISAYQVASIIADPISNGIKFISPLSANSVSFANVQTSLIGNIINANIAIDLRKNNSPRHTEWILLEEGNPKSMPTALLNKKLIDSLLGHDSFGNLVPDINLSYRSRYGIGIRPQQTLFDDRLEALRNLIEFTNSVLIKNLITGNYVFDNLLSYEKIPNEIEGDYDLIVDTELDLDQVSTEKLDIAKLSCEVYNGKIVSVDILQQGYGYKLPPKVTVNSDTGSNGVIELEIDEIGRVISATIVDGGKNYLEDTVLEVRPFTVYVQANENYGGRWTKHIFEYQNRFWIKIKTQTYNTTLFWKYVDWIDPTYDGFKDYQYVLDNTYELSKVVEINPGDYVKIKNAGDGRFIILERISENQIGNYATGYNVIYSENGTIQILDSIWDYSQSEYAYDVGTLEETLYDQLPDRELNYILLALKDDIFTKELQVYWNLFFFKAVRYALTEQKLLDWAFKTSFININNTIGNLDQRPVYKLDNEKYFEEYIKEVKPYRTKIRNYTSEYTSLDVNELNVTDFDLPSYYNSATGKLDVIELTNPLINQHPRKDWKDNYKYYVKDILIADGGANYTSNPTLVLTTATGDTGYGAKAEAYLRNGKIYKVIVTDPGQDYTIPPILSIQSSGNNIVTASMSVILGNDTVRKNNVTIKLDRVSTEDEIGNPTVTEVFSCSGQDIEFKLNWLADADKTKILILLDKKLILSNSYTLEYYIDNGQKTCKIKLNKIVPKAGQILEVTYNKHISLYHAVDRINKFYNPTEEMPGKELPLLMSGAEYSSSILQGLSFDYSTPWGQGVYDVNSAWSDLTDYYASSYLVQDALYGANTLYVNTVTGISVGQKVTLGNTSTNYFRKNLTVRSVNNFSNSIALDDYNFRIKRIWADSTSTQGTVVFYTKEYFGGDIRVGDFADISNVDNGTTVTGFDGRYLVTGVGNDRFTAIGTGSHATSILSTTSVRSLSLSANVYIPVVLQNLDVETAYLMYEFRDSVQSQYVVNGYINFDTQIPVNQVAGFKIYSSAYGPSELMDISSVAPGVEHYITSVSAQSTYVISAYNIAPTTYRVKVYGYPKLEFWKDNFNVNGVDTELSAGSWNSTGQFVGALGVNPTDLIRTGAGFLSVEHGYAPEEHVKGHTLESVGINVYTQDNFSSPLVVAGTVPVTKNQTSVSRLSQTANEAVALTLEYEGKIFDRLMYPPDPESIGPYFSTNPATPIGVVGAPIASGAGDDTFTGPYNLGFGWNMFGTVYTQVYVGTNGYLTFGGGDTEYTPLNINALENPSIMIMYCDLWQELGESGQLLEGGQLPGLWFDTGTSGPFQYWRLRFQGSHYEERDTPGSLPAYQYEVGLYSDGTNQYVEMIYENTWRGSNFNGDTGFITGIASENGAENIEIPYTSIQNNTSHVFYSTYNGGDWKYAGQGSVDPNKDQYNFTATNQFFIYGNDLYIAPQDSNGRAGYTMITMGGDYYLDTNLSTTINGQTEVAIASLASLSDVKSAYVTVNGQKINQIFTTSDYGYILEPVGGNNNRAGVKVYNLPPGAHTVQAWFFGMQYADFNSLSTEIFTISSATAMLTVTNILSTIEPVSAQILVEHEFAGGSGRYRLYPPDVTYYIIDGNQLTYNINNDVHPTGTYDINNVKVYANGASLRPGFDFNVDSNSGTVILSYGLLSSGDTIAIESLVNYDYFVTDNRLIFTNPLQISSGTVKVTSFNDHNGMILRTENFIGNATGRYVMSLPAASANYVWVYVNGSQLVAGTEYELLPDSRTIQLSELVNTTPSDEILITSITTPAGSNVILGYRIFKDIFDRNNYTRLTDFYSTRLTKELTVESQEIEVEDASQLIPPNPAKNVPGVIFVDSERIEFFEKRDNKLSNLRRSTYGTGPANYSEAGTKIIDQSLQQQMPYKDSLYKQYHITSSTTGTYVLTTVTNSYGTYTIILSTSSFVYNTGTIYTSYGDGIQLNSSAAYRDQIKVFYGGRPLRKSSISVHDTRVSYNSTITSLVTLPPEFDVEYNAGTQKYELKLHLPDIIPGVRVDVTHATGLVWQGTNTSLLYSESVQSKFIRQKTTTLPDNYYYGGDPVLTDDTNFELTDDNDNPLEGY